MQVQVQDASSGVYADAGVKKAGIDISTTLRARWACSIIAAVRGGCHEIFIPEF